MVKQEAQTQVVEHAPVYWPTIFTKPAESRAAVDKVAWGNEQRMALRGARNQRGLSQQKVADRVGMERRRYSNIEWIPSDGSSNDTRPTQAELDKIVGFLSK